MGSVLDYYYSRSKIWLPMTAENHDSSNNRTLDVSGNGNHALLGDGATVATFPAKLQKRGYSFDGSSDYAQTAYNPNSTAGTLSVLFTSNSDTDNWIMGSFDGTTSSRCYLTISTILRGGIGGDGLIQLPGTTPIHPHKHHFAAITWNGSTVNLILDDNVELSKAQVGSVNSSIPLAVGAFNNNGGSYNYFNGKIYQCAVFEQALDLQQLRDLKTEMFKQVNHV